MFLKQIDLLGFKSFANRTSLAFEKGLTAIVGPNGCGKSNVSDAVRWVLGEQSAKALRGGNMTDVIFNGTDLQKPMGMAEVSLHLAECENTLGVEFNEVTITRRVLRSGEGQYFINRAPCRLKDIQRLFMDTGIGTQSYSVLEQGRIDRILSSRPDDRREVFEEASGITKYKADKREALRKLDHTENNLLRLEDIIAEVKRQIISLQRQAGKARRYKQMHARLRSLDIFVTRERLDEMDQLLENLNSRIGELTRLDETLHADVRGAEQRLQHTRESLARIEAAIQQTLDDSVRTQTELDRTRQHLQTNRERILELRDLSNRNAHEAQSARERLEEHRKTLETISRQLEEASAAHQEVSEQHKQKQTAFNTFDQLLQANREQHHRLQSEAVDVENRRSHLQNELGELEARERGATIKRERLKAEQSEMRRTTEQYEIRIADKTGEVETLAGEVNRRETRIQQLRNDRDQRRAGLAAHKEQVGDLQRQLAAKQAQIDLLERADHDQEPYPGGARFLMHLPADTPLEPDAFLGALADHIEARSDYQQALEAVLRPWIDALVVRDRETARRTLRFLQQEKLGAARLLAADTQGLPPIKASADNLPGTPLIDHVTCDEQARDLMQHLLATVRVIDSLDLVPEGASPALTWVTTDGLVARGPLVAECWMPESDTGNPLTRKHRISDWTQEARNIEQQLEQARATIAGLTDDQASEEAILNQAREELAHWRHQLAVCEGETQQINREAKQTRERAETIEWELNELEQQESSGDNRRVEISREIERLRDRHASIRQDIQQLTETLRNQENERATLHGELTECRIRVSETRHRVDQLRHQEDPLRSQIQSLEQIIEDRARGISTYQQHMDKLEASIGADEQAVPPLEEQVKRHEANLAEAREQRNQAHQQQAALEEDIRRKHAAQETNREQRTELEVQATEHRMRRQNLVDRMVADYQLREEQLADEPAPEWEQDTPDDRENLETSIAELRTKLNSMGPVNLVAIEEHAELEERYQFLSQQQNDLVEAKQQLLEMIKKINQTTTELFSETFNKVNECFQGMFAQLFGGGSAKLVLVNEEDVLESGIEIIARPPGKKLQNISLLSGGERTMTAVALLFALYKVKPSPFCVLDELDAALDDSNIGRFVKTVQGFLEHSQFIVITHSRQTISAADVIYGVTMEKHGVSNVVAVRLSQHEQEEQQPSETTGRAEQASDALATP